MLENEKLKRPERLHVPTAERCNNRCMFCMEFPRDTGILPSPDMVRRQLEVNKDIGVVLFTAGEPTLNPDLVSRVAAARDIGYHTICLITNGRLLADRELCVRLLESGLNDITVSIHGHRADIHDALTGVPGSFDETWRGISNLNELVGDFSYKFSLSTVVNKINLRYLAEMVEVFFSQNVAVASFKTPRIAGRSLKFLDRIVAPLPDVADAVRSVIDGAEDKLPRFSSRALRCFSGIPYCLMYGYEMYVGVDEVVLGLFKRDTSTQRIENMADTFKRAECAACAYDGICYGVEKEYTDRFGWEAFKPRERISEAFKLFLENPNFSQQIKSGLSNVSEEDKKKAKEEIDEIIGQLKNGDDLPDKEKARLAFEVGVRYMMLDQHRRAVDYFDYVTKQEAGHGGAHLKKAWALASIYKTSAARCSLKAARRYCEDPISLEEIDRLSRLID